jgi:lipopolysaccharide export LptBFGC system permease protein LptF
VIRTLHGYIGRELLKVTGLALVAFTLVMTVFAIIEPLRKQGLAPTQVAALFGYTLPVMLSLTLPIAALFASTIVYGRFSQDNELMACRASGVPTLTLLEPALLLGAAVTVLSLVLGSFVTPRLAEMGERAAKANARGIVYSQLTSEDHAKFNDILIRADRVYEDEDTLRGTVVAQVDDPGDVRIYLASTAYLSFFQRSDESYVSAYLVNPQVVRTGGYVVGQEGSQQFDSWPLPDLVEEDPSWYDWGRLVYIYRHPEAHPEIRRQMESLHNKVRHAMAARAVAAGINAAGEYAELTDGQDRFVLRAGKAEWEGGPTVRLLPGSEGGKVEVRVIRDKSVRQVVTANEAEVSASLSQIAAHSRMSIDVRGDVFVRTAVEDGEFVPHQRSEWGVGGLEVPADVARQADVLKPGQLYKLAEQNLVEESVQEDIDRLQRRVPKLMSEILAEMHSRVAYGVSCFLLVAMGSALGLIFRGGEIISAFALCVVPAALVIVLVIMGREMVGNPDVPVGAGLAAIWGGIVALLAGGAGIYMYLARK